MPSKPQNTYRFTFKYFQQIQSFDTNGATEQKARNKALKKAQKHWQIRDYEPDPENIETTLLLEQLPLPLE